MAIRYFVQMRRFCFAVLLLLSAATVLPGEVTRWEIKTREPYANGKSHGDRGSYERWTGIVHYAIDPKLTANRAIIDLELAPTTKDGKVEFSADFELLVPSDRAKANGALFYEVNNRGNRTAPNIIDGGADDFLCRRGFVILSSGWIAEVQPGGGRSRLNAPIPLENGKPLRGIVRNEVVVDSAVAKASVSHRGNQGSYRPATDKLKEATLTRREREADKREPVPADHWKLIVTDVEAGGVKGQLPLVELELRGGLQPGWIYEIIYEAEGSFVQGTGFAAIRDIVSALKFAATKELNPLLDDAGKSLITRTIGFGTSQSGRCLRHFLWEGFNADEQGRKVFDGVIPHVAGGGLGSFNHRFASPTRTNGQHEEHLFPADFFPFTYGDEQDPFTGETDGILAKSRKKNVVPKVFHTQSSSEYWHRSGSLVHTDPLGTRDAEIPGEVRIYTFGGAAHGPGSGIPTDKKSGGQLPPSPVDYRPFMRGLVVAMDEWIKDGREPPESRYPDIRALIDWRRDADEWPKASGVEYPKVIQQPPLLDRGPLWKSKRIATIEPPLMVLDEKNGTTRHYRVLIPWVDELDGNVLVGALRHPVVRDSFGTYTSWNLRDKSIGAAGELFALQGGYLPFPRTRAEGDAAGDRRPSFAVHADFAAFQENNVLYCEALIEDRYILAEELPRLLAHCKKYYDRHQKP
jgi:hypothetical protein